MSYVSLYNHVVVRLLLFNLLHVKGLSVSTLSMYLSGVMKHETSFLQYAMRSMKCSTCHCLTSVKRAARHHRTRHIVFPLRLTLSHSPSMEIPIRAYMLLSFQKMIPLTRHRGSLSKTTDRYVLFVFTVLTVMPR